MSVSWAFPPVPGTHSKTPASTLLWNYARLGWDLCLGQIIPHLLLWDFHILFRNIWRWCLSQMGYWVRWSLDHTKTCSQTCLFLKGLLKQTDPASPSNISYQTGSASLQKASSLMSHREALALSQAASLRSPLPQPSSLHNPKLLLNQDSYS